jgi:hypothetical protein
MEPAEVPTVKSPLEPRECRVCSECVGEPFLSGMIEKDGARAICSYCEEEGNTFSVDQIANTVGIILQEFYHRPDYDRETAPPEGAPLREIINELTEMRSDGFAEDVRSVLAERDAIEREETLSDDNPFGPDACYGRSSSVDTWDFDRGWYRFEETLKTETRYFNKHAEDVLASIFEGIDAYRTRLGRPVIVEAGPGTDLETLYRARVFQTERELREAMKRPDLQVGPPRSEKAVAGRMNAAGVAVFYGATDRQIALNEVRPPVGSKVLIVVLR